MTKCVTCSDQNQYICSEKCADWKAVMDFMLQMGFEFDGENYVQDNEKCSKQQAWLFSGCPTNTLCWKNPKYYPDKQLIGGPQPGIDSIVESLHQTK